MRIRAGNDFTLNWEIERGGIAEGIQSAISRKLFLKRHREVREITDYEITGEGNIIHIEFTPNMLFGLGDYVLELHYVLSDTSLSDEDRRCAVDVDAFTIVARTAMADNVTEMVQTSDIALALRGKSAYDLWRETHEGTEDDYFAYLRQPATDAAASVSELEQTVSDNEGLRVTAEQGRSDAELLREGAENDRIAAEGIRDENETDRINAEGDREDAEDLRDQAEIAREEAEEARANAEGDATKGRVKAENERVTAEGLRDEAEGLRELAELARANAEGDATKGRVKAENDRVAAEVLRNETFDQKMGEADGKIEEMNTTLSTYDGRVTQVESDIDQLAGEVEQLAYVKIKNEAVNGNFENGLIAPFSKIDGSGGGASTLAINSSTPISGNYDVRLTIITPTTLPNNPTIDGLHRAGNIGDKIYLHFYAKILSGVPTINAINNGAGARIIYGGDVINGRNTRIIDVKSTGDFLGRIYFNSPSVWDMQMDNFIRINLTETFGAGNEPTEEEMNLLLDIAGISYIDDEVIIPAQKIMQWQQQTLKQVDDSVSQLAGDVNLFKEESNLKDAIQDSKIKDIENVLSTANLGQSAQLSASGVSPLSLPKNAANGGMSVKLEGLTAENLMVNGNFVNGFTGWFIGSNVTERRVADSILSFTGGGKVSSTTNNWVRQNNVSKFPGGHVLCNIVTARSFVGARFYVGVSYSSSTFDLTDKWVTYSHLGNAASFNVPNYGAELGDPVEMTNAMCFDLTAIFGEGNEPTKEQCAIIFSDYFEGVKSFEPTGRVRSVDKNGLNPTHLYLTNNTKLRSLPNGVKDEIRKGANGYELVKRVGVGSLGSELITNVADREFSSDTGWWNKLGNTVIENGVVKITSDGTANNRLYRNNALTPGKWYILEYEVTSNTLVGGHTGNQLYTNGLGNVSTGDSYLNSSVGKHKYYAIGKGVGEINIRTYPSTTTSGSIEIDNISVVEISTVGAKTDSYVFTELSDGTVHYTLATPEIIPISYGGVLNSAENGTVYHEPIIADAGVYDTKMDILLTDYPIASIEEIIKHENGVDTYLNVASAVVAGDGLSFTHPDLADGDLVLFTYAYDKESTNGNVTATFYDSNVVKIDTITGKAYRINEVVTNGVLTRTLTEV